MFRPALFLCSGAGEPVQETSDRPIGYSQAMSSDLGEYLPD